MEQTADLNAQASNAGTGCLVHTRVYKGGQLEAEGFPPADISEYLTDPQCVVWLDLLDPEAQDLEMVTEEFGLHPLAVEDAVHDHQRPKVDRYETHLFVDVYSVDFDDEAGALRTSELSAFVTNQALITVRKDKGLRIDGVVAQWDSNADLIKYGVGALLWGLLDYVVDQHFGAVQQLDEAIEGLEDDLFADKPRSREVQRRSFEIRKSLVLFRRASLPMREVVNTLMRRDVHTVDEALVPYFQDIYDHVLRVTEWTESLRDLVTSILETNLSIQSNKMNEVMKQLTAWAAIIAVPTAITGYYGQNVPYPGFNKEWGFLVSVSAIVLISGGLWVLFRKKEWL